jgi:hypothetical protein
MELSVHTGMFAPANLADASTAVLAKEIEQITPLLADYGA